MPRLNLIEIEVLVAAGAVGLLVLCDRPLRRLLDPLSRAFARIAAHRGRAIALCGAFGFAVSGLLSAAHPTEPRVHDEWSYVLAADTFASGRLSNPPHPFWEHFESFHILSQPTYQSKYPPAPGLFLALGQRLTGHPVVGTWIAMGLACAALCWMLQASVPARFAMLGGLLPPLCFGIFESGALFAYWSRSYWGGGVPMLGGALVYGALPRITRRPRARDSTLFGVGLFLLANSRPWEGLVVSAPALLVLGGWLVTRRGRNRGAAWRRAALPLGAVVAVSAAAMGLYHYRVTGDPLLMPYQVYEQTYSAGIRGFFTGETREPSRVYHNPQMRSYYQSSAPEDFREQDPLKALRARLAYHLETLWAFYLGPVLTPPLFFLPFALRDRFTQLALLVCGAIVLQIALVSWFFIHYSAPAAAPLLLLVVQGLRVLRAARVPRALRSPFVRRLAGRRPGRPAARALLAVAALFCVVGTAHFARDMRQSPPEWNYRRAAVRRALEAEPGRHLVFVRYTPDHSVHYEWVYNEADIDAARIVWARELDPESNRRLREYFEDRRAWIVHADAIPPELVPLP